MPQAQKRPRFGTLTMRMSISFTPSISRASFAALAGNAPLLVVPSRMILPLSADRMMAAISALSIRSTKVVRTFISSSLSARARILCASSQMILIIIDVPTERVLVLGEHTIAARVPQTRTPGVRAT